MSTDDAAQGGQRTGAVIALALVLWVPVLLWGALVLKLLWHILLGAAVLVVGLIAHALM